MDSDRKTEVAENLVMLWSSLKQLYSFLKEKKISVLLDVRAFGSSYEKKIEALALNSDKETKIQIIKLLEYISKTDLGGTDENPLYQAMIQQQKSQDTENQSSPKPKKISKI